MYHQDVPHMWNLCYDAVPMLKSSHTRRFSTKSKLDASLSLTIHTCSHISRQMNEDELLNDNSNLTDNNDTGQVFTDRFNIVWTPDLIRHEIELRGHTLTSLARELELHESAIRKVLRKSWPKVERILSVYLGANSPAELFPDRYTEQGLPKKYSSSLGNKNAKRGSK